ncbi:MAG: hypothetical protein AAFP69_08915 [Planctomycetota bacterium]
MYLILSAIDYNGAPAIESLGRSHIQNTDGDLVPEVVDAWDQPIQFVRWPAGFLPEMGRVTGRDQMDFLRKDFRFHDGDTTSNPVNLPPLIVSAGDDGVFDLLLNERFYALDSDGDADAGSNENFAYATLTYPASANVPGEFYYPDPYYNVVGRNFNSLDAMNGNGFGGLIDTDGDGATDGAADNLHNMTPEK